MKRLLLSLIFGIFLPTLICKADTTPAAINSLPIDSNYTYTQPSGFLSDISPDYTIKKPLVLTKVSTSRSKETFMFVFLMNNKAEENKPQEDSEHIRNRMHVLWTGSKKIVKEQKLIKDEYPVDVSIANYDDGYDANACNVVLPNRKPRGVSVSFVWSF